MDGSHADVLGSMCMLVVSIVIEREVVWMNLFCEATNQNVE